MRFEVISFTRFVRLAGQLGVERVRLDYGGSSWLLPAGGLVAERRDGDRWSYHLFSDD